MALHTLNPNFRFRRRLSTWLPLVWVALALQWSAPMALSETPEGVVRICSLGGQLIAEIHQQSDVEDSVCPDCVAQPGTDFVGLSAFELQQRFEAADEPCTSTDTYFNIIHQHGGRLSRAPPTFTFLRV